MRSASLSRRGLSNIIATLILMTIVVVSGLVIYTYSANAVNQYVHERELKNYESLSLDIFRLTEEELIAYIRNIGDVDIEFQVAYVNGEMVNGPGYSLQVNGQGDSDDEIITGETGMVKILTPTDYAEGEVYDIVLITVRGSKVKFKAYMVPPLTQKVEEGQSSIHDLAILYISAPSNAYPGENLLVEVLVENQGDHAESFTLSLCFDGETDSWVESIQPREAVTYFVNWDTSEMAPGQYELNSTIIPVEGEIDIDDNHKSVNITLQTPMEVIHVGDIDLKEKQVKGRSGKWSVNILVRVHDFQHQGLSDVTVTVEWSGGITGTETGLTDDNGEVLFETGDTEGTSITLIVINLEKEYNLYDPEVNHDPEEDSDGTLITIYQ
jgi:hypothetical protein